MRIRASLLAIASTEAPLRPMSGRVCQWKPFWIPVEDSFKKASLEEWVFISDVPSEGPEDPMVHDTDHRLPGCRSIPLRYLGSLRSPKIKRAFGDELRHHCLRCGHDQNVTSFIHVSAAPFPSIWYCRFQMRLSCPATKNSTPQEMIFFTSWAKLSDHEILVQHMEDIEKATAEFREASERKHVLVNALRPVRLCKGDSASTTGTLDPVGEKKMPSNNKLQEGGTSLPCRRRPNMLTTSFSRIAFT